jgi:anti-sigma factor RsiW
MTPQSNSQNPTAHLTEEQFDQLLGSSNETACPDNDLVEAHLLSCESCSAELASLRESISLFREASNAYANAQLMRQPNWILPTRPNRSRAFVPLYWAAATAIFLTALLPLQMLRRHTSPAPQPEAATAFSVADRSAQSDEALLEDVNSEVSASVPTSMQALADPTADASALNSDTSDPTSTQRKD